jgi:hypothetical protein
LAQGPEEKKGFCGRVAGRSSAVIFVYPSR